MLVIMHYGPAGNVIAIRAGQDYQVQDVWAVPMVRSDWPSKMADATCAQAGIYADAVVCGSNHSVQGSEGA